MKKIILFLNCLVAPVLANAQSPAFEWAKQFGGVEIDNGRSITVDASGNVYTTGFFSGTVDFDPGSGTANLTSSVVDIFISKLDASGSFIWAKKMGGNNVVKGYSIVLDALGNVYTTGYFYGTADFDPGAGTFNLTAVGNFTLFISKLDASGNFVWAKSVGGTSSDIQGTSIKVDASGNVYTTGKFSSTCDFDPGASVFNLSADSLYDNFILKLNPSGNFVWVKNMGEQGSSIALDALGNVFSTGIFFGTTDFDPGPGIYNLISAGASDIFIAKLNSSGNFVWAKRLGGTSYDETFSVAVDISGNIYSTGRFNGTSDFDPGIGTFNLTDAGGFWDIFISKLNSSGDFVWAKRLGGTALDQAYALDLDTSGNVYTTGIFNGSADFDPDAGTFNLTSSGNFDIFISKLNPSGNLVWAKNIGGASADWGISITVDGAGNVFSTGYFSGTADFDPSAGLYNLTSAGYDDIFVHKMNQCNLPAATITPAGSTTFCSGGSVILNANTGAGLTYQWKNNGTDISGATNSSHTANTSGSYTVVVTKTCGSATSAAVTVTVNPLPTVSFSGLAASYNVSASAATLTGSPSGGTFSGPGISGNMFTPSVAGAGGPYTITYSYTDGNGCSNNSSQQTTVTSCAVPAQPGTITVTGGSAKVCPGDTRTYTIAVVPGATSYTWTAPAGATIVSGQGNTSVSINYTAGFTASGTLSVVASSVCGSSIAKTLTVSRNVPSIPGVISGAASAVCAGTSGSYSVTNVAGITYNWTAPANASIISGQGTNSVTVSFSALWISGSLKVTATNNCATSGARTLSILSKPATPSTITGASNTVCAGTTGSYSVTNVPGVNYNWTAPANASIASGQGTNAVSVNFSALFTSGPLKVSGSNVCGSSALRTLSISSKPAKPGTISGPGFNNCNVTGIYTIVPVLYATSYTWSTNIAGAVVTPSGTSASIAFPTFTSGIVSVTSNNACGSSAAKTLTVKGTPATPVSITGPTLVCANQFGVPYSIAAIPNATSYTWTGMTGSHISDGTVTSSGTTLTTTSTSVTVNFGSTSGNLSVKANNPCGAGSNKTLAIGFNCREGEIFSENSFDVKVLPNPSSGDFVFKIENAPVEKISINIYDMIGKLVLSETVNNPQVTIRDQQLVPGIYSAEVICAENKKVMKLLKIK